MLQHFLMNVGRNVSTTLSRMTPYKRQSVLWVFCALLDSHLETSGYSAPLCFQMWLQNGKVHYIRCRFVRLFLSDWDVKMLRQTIIILY